MLTSQLLKNQLFKKVDPKLGDFVPYDPINPYLAQHFITS